MGPIPALVLHYFTISSLVVQWDLPPLYFFPGGRVKPECYPHVNLDNKYESLIKHSSDQVFL